MIAMVDGIWNFKLRLVRDDKAPRAGWEIRCCVCVRTAWGVCSGSNETVPLSAPLSAPKAIFIHYCKWRGISLLRKKRKRSPIYTAEATQERTAKCMLPVVVCLRSPQFWGVRPVNTGGTARKRN